MSEEFRVFVPNDCIDHICMSFNVTFEYPNPTEELAEITKSFDEAQTLAAKANTTVEVKPVVVVMQPSAIDHSDPVIKRSSSQWVLKDEVIDWLLANVKGKWDSEVDDNLANFRLVFSDLQEATHFKLRFVGT